MLKEFTVASGKARLAGVQDGAADALRTPVIFLHAGVADGRMWQAQLDEFAPRHRVVAYDRRGFGKTRGPARSEEHTSELQSLMRISYAVFCLHKNNIFTSLHYYSSC